MQAFRFMVFFAIISALAGAVSGVMDYTVAHGGTNWFPGADTHTLDNRTFVSQDQIDSMDYTEGDLTDVGSDSRSFSMIGLGISIIKGIFWIAPELNDILKVEDPDNPGNNLFWPFIAVIQLGIWCIYAIGGIQVWRNSNYKYNY